MRVEHPDCGHDFPKEMRDKSYAWNDAVLLAAGNAREKTSQGRKADLRTRWVDVRELDIEGKGWTLHEVVLRPPAREGGAVVRPTWVRT